MPERIKAELDRNLAGDPYWYEQRGFRLTTRSDGSEAVEQAPGPGNALGRVKLLFRNPHNVYLHDSPERALFRRPVRAYSHGCVRVEGALDLTRRLLALDRHPHQGVTEVLLGMEEEVTLVLRTPVPIVIEYDTVSVDVRGRVRFHPDVYGLEAPAP